MTEKIKNKRTLKNPRKISSNLGFPICKDMEDDLSGGSKKKFKIFKIFLIKSNQ